MKKAARNKKETEMVEEPVEKPKIVAEIEPEKPKKSVIKKLFSNKPILIGTIVVLLIAIAGGAIYAISYFAEDAAGPQPLAQEVEALLEEVGEIVVMPEDETPTVATVTDVEKLSTQPFFTNAQNGDKVIIFGNARQAILYRPSIKKIIAMSPIDANSLPQAQDAPQATDSATQAISVTPTPKEKIKVVVMNSTKEAGLARKGGDLLDEDTFEIIASLNATGEYDKTTVSTVNGGTISDSDLNSIISTFSKVKVTKTTLPSSEAAPAGADIVVILGSDFSEEY